MKFWKLLDEFLNLAPRSPEPLGVLEGRKKDTSVSEQAPVCPAPTPPSALPTSMKPGHPKFYILNLFAFIGFIEKFPKI